MWPCVIKKACAIDDRTKHRQQNVVHDLIMLLVSQACLLIYLILLKTSKLILNFIIAACGCVYNRYTFCLKKISVENICKMPRNYFFWQTNKEDKKVKHGTFSLIILWRKANVVGTFLDLSE